MTAFVAPSHDVTRDMTKPMAESIKLALLAKNLNYETLNGGVDPGLLQRHAQDSSGYISTLELIGEELGVAPLHEKDLKVVKYFVQHVLPYFQRTVETNDAREGLDLFVEATAHLENSLCANYFGGKTPNLVDYGLFPWFNKLGQWLPEIRRSECPQLISWIKRMREDSLVQTVAKAAFDVQELNHFNSLNEKERCLG